MCAAPAAAPTMPISEIGVSITRSSPNRVEQALGDLERAAVRADVLAEAEDVRVALHLLEERLADRLEIGDLGHQCVPPSSTAPARRPLVHGGRATPSRNQSGGSRRRIGVDADERVERLGRRRLLGDVGGVVDLRCTRASIAASSSAADRLGRREHARRSGRSDRSRAPSARSRRPARTTGCRARRVPFGDRSSARSSVTPSPRRARSTASLRHLVDREHVVAVGLLAGNAVADRLVDELLRGASASTSAWSTRSRCSRRSRRAGSAAPRRS